MQIFFVCYRENILYNITFEMESIKRFYSCCFIIFINFQSVSTNMDGNKTVL